MSSTIIVRSPSQRSSSQPRRMISPQPNWIQWFVVLQIVFQLLLLTSITTGPFRAVIRILAFGISLLFLVFTPAAQVSHPASKSAVVAVVIVALSLFHPDTTLLAGLAQLALYLAILAPLFWIPRLRVDAKVFRRVLLTFWAFHSISALFGILQVYYPGRFQPNLSTVVAERGAAYVQSLTFALPGGQHVLRPMGLTDIPGGAGTAGFYAVLLGLGFLLTERNPLQRCLCVVSMFLGMTCIYLSQVRAMLVMTVLCMIALFVVIALQGSTRQLAALASIVGGIVLVSFLWAVSVGGSKVSQRIGSLTEESPTAAYYKNRGGFLEYTVKDLLPRYPLGAGLGRWGMTSAYFGDRAKAIWVEIQWTGWLLDGGIPLILAYAITLALAFKTAWTIALRNQTGLKFWGAVLLAYNLGALALTFAYPLFIGQVGMEFWMLNAALFAAARVRPAVRFTRRSALVPSPSPAHTLQSAHVAHPPTHLVSGRRLRPNRWNGPGESRPRPLSR